MHFKTAAIPLLAILVLLAGALPGCALEGCCAKDAGTSVHAQMPCCEDATIPSLDAVTALPPVSAGLTATASAAAIELPDASTLVPTRDPILPVAAPSAHHPTDPPLFLLNAQLLI